MTDKMKFKKPNGISTGFKYIIILSVIVLFATTGCFDDEEMMRELKEAHEAELQTQYELGRRDGRREAFDDSQEETFQQGHNEGFSEGLQQAREEARRQYIQRINTLEQHVERLERDNAEKISRISSLETNIENLRDSYNSLNTRNNAIERERNQYRDELRDLQDEREKLLTQLRRAIERIDAYEREREH